MDSLETGPRAARVGYVLILVGAVAYVIGTFLPLLAHFTLFQSYTEEPFLAGSHPMLAGLVELYLASLVLAVVALLGIGGRARVDGLWIAAVASSLCWLADLLPTINTNRRSAGVGTGSAYVVFVIAGALVTVGAVVVVVTRRPRLTDPTVLSRD